MLNCFPLLLGEGVDDSWKVGQAVFWAGFGVSFREYVVLDPTGKEGWGVFKVPDAKPEWTAIPVSAMTAVGALELDGHIKQGQTVLVTAAAGKLTYMMSTGSAGPKVTSRD